MTLSSPQGPFWRGRKDLKNQTHDMTFQHFCFCCYTWNSSTSTPIPIVYTTTIQELFEYVSKKDRSESIILCTTSKLGLCHFAQQCWMAPLNVHQIPSWEKGNSRQLLITIHHHKMPFWPSGGYDAVPRLLCHVTSILSMFVNGNKLYT